MAKTQTKTLSPKELAAAFLSTKEEIYEVLPTLFFKDTFFPFLDFLTKWQHYSIYNVILLYKQYPYATYLASFKRWKELSMLSGNGPYHTILKSEYHKKGITLLIPFSLYRIDSGPKERSLSYHPIHVFDASQVNNIPYQAPFVPFVPIGDLTFMDFISLISNVDKNKLRFLQIKMNTPHPRQKGAYYLKDTIFYDPKSVNVKEAFLYAYICYVTRLVCSQTPFKENIKQFICLAATRSIFHFYQLPGIWQSQDDVHLLYDLEMISKEEKNTQLSILHHIQQVIKSCIYRIKSGFTVQLATNCDWESEKEILHLLANDTL